MLDRTGGFALLTMLAGGCSQVVEQRSCAGENAGDSCVVVLDAEIELTGSNVERIVIVAALGGVYVPGGQIELASAEVLRPEATGPGGTFYNHYPLELAIAPGDERYDGRGDASRMILERPRVETG